MNFSSGLFLGIVIGAFLAVWVIALVEAYRQNREVRLARQAAKGWEKWQQTIRRVKEKKMGEQYERIGLEVRRHDL